MSKRNDRIDIIFDLYNQLYNDDYRPTHDAMCWFKTTVDDKFVMVGVDKQGHIIYINKKKDIKIATYLINNQSIDYSIIPDYIIIGFNAVFLYEDLFNVCRKKSGYDYEDLTLSELDEVIELMILLQKIYQRFNAKINKESVDFFHNVEIENDRLKLNKSVLDRNLITFKNNAKPSVEFNPKQIVEDVAAILVFELNIPVCSRKREQIINPYLFIYERQDSKQCFYFILDVPKNKIASEIITILNGFDSIPDHIIFYATIASELISILESKKISLVTSLDADAQYNDINHILAVILKDNYDYLIENHFIEMDDLIEGFNKVADLKRFLYNKFNFEEYDEYLIETVSPEYYQLFEHYLGPNIGLEIIAATMFPYYIFEQYYYLDAPDDDRTFIDEEDTLQESAIIS